MAGRGLHLGWAQLPPSERSPIRGKLVVLCFDDAVKTQRTFVAPMLKELGLNASFFVTHRWMADHENFMTWEEIAELHRMGFEVGNHSWTHDDFSTPRNAARLAGELALVERALANVGVPRPESFAYPGNSFSPEAVRVLEGRGYRFARRGTEPEVPYQEMQSGPLFDPMRHHPLLIPTTGDSHPGWTAEHFQHVVSGAQIGKIVVLQFHGVPDRAHPWVYTPPENFRKYMAFLKENGFRGIALRDLKQCVDLKRPPADPNLAIRYPNEECECHDLPLEMLATRADLRYWLKNMLCFHQYTLAEAAEVCGMTEDEVKKQAMDFGFFPPSRVSAAEQQIRVLPYPGGRSPRIGFQEGEINPMRGTKASVSLPWDPSSYVVVDLPEAIFCNLGLIFLAHTDIPTIWNDQNIVLENIDWQRAADGLSYQRTLPSGIRFGASIRPLEDHVEMDLWVRNFGGRDLSGFETETYLRAQVCVMLKGAAGFSRQTKDNKVIRDSVAAVRSDGGNRWILTMWEQPGRVWDNPEVPCIHSDPNLPYCPFGKTVHARGCLWFYEGKEIDREMKRGVRYLTPE